MKKTRTEETARKALEIFAEHGIDAGREKILVGFSGGPDSTVLLYLLSRVLSLDVSALHVNHMLRGAESDADEAFCRLFCESNGIPFFVKKTDVGAISGGVSVEETARNERYRAFAETAAENGMTLIATAHTASDNAETVLFNLVRGSGISGLRGIPPVRRLGDIDIIRPLIGCERAEITEFLSENSLLYVTDATNADTAYTRNYIRHRIIPALSEVNTAAVKNICALSASAAADEEFISSVAADFISGHLRDGAVNAGELLSLRPAVSGRVISAMYKSASGEALPRNHVALTEEFLRAGKPGRLELPGKISAVFYDGKLKITPYLSEKDGAGDFEYTLGEGINTFAEGFSLCLFMSRGELEKAEADISRLGDESACAARIFLPASVARHITVRSRRPADAYKVMGMTKTVKKLLSTVNTEARRRRPVICDVEGVLWTPGFGVRDDVYGSTDKSAVLVYFGY